jgi:hypothetical protein
MAKSRIVPYFGGLWAVVGEPPDERRMRTAMHFFGEEYVVFLDFEKPNRIEQAMCLYVLDEGEMSVQHLNGDETEDMPIIEVKWSLEDGRYLHFIEGRKMSRWGPVTVEQLVDEGYPQIVFESLRNHFVETGSFYLTEALVPDASVFEALRKGTIRRR